MSETVFFCYSKTDQESVLPLATALRNRGVPVWLDQWSIAPGADWDRSVDDALEASGKFLIALSPDAMESREVRGELRVALDARKHSVPVLLRKCALPRQLRNTQYVDFTGVAPTDETRLSALVVALSSRRPASDEASPPREHGSAKLGLSSQRLEAPRPAAIRPSHRPLGIRLATGLLWGVFAIEFVLWLSFPKWGSPERMFSFGGAALAAVDLALLAC